MNWTDLLHICHEKNVPFFSYRFPSSSKFVVGVQRASDVEVVADFKSLKLNQKGFFVAPFLFGDGASAYFIKEDFRMEGEKISEDLTTYLSSLPNQSLHNYASPSMMQKADYLERVNRLIETIRNGKAGKVVFSRNIVASLVKDFDWAAAYRNILEECSNAFVYCFYLPNQGLWMGATPELLLRKNDDRIETVALAGTMSSSLSTWSAKNSEEQAMVVRYVEDVLQAFNVRNMQKNGPISVPAGNVCHLKTIFSALLSEEGAAIPLLAALHPTPAVCGYPKDSAMQLIKATESIDRSFYSGFLGPVADGDFDFYVNLRSMRLYADVAELFVGGGIMKDSEPEDEWNETLLKSKTMGYFVGLK